MTKQDEDELWPHEVAIKDAGLWEYRDDILRISNGLITSGLKLASSLEYKSLDDEYDKKWDLIDARKLRYVKSMCSLINDIAEDKGTKI